MLNAKKRKIMLNQGGFLFGEPGTHIHSILGSCVAITLWHPKLQIGGMCHFVLPRRGIAEMNHGELPEGRYGEEAMKLFNIAAHLHGTRLSEYHAKVFGGSDNIDDNHEDGIGERNTAKAMQMLAVNDIPLMMAHVGEIGSRRIVFDVENGDVWVRHTGADGHVLMSQSGRN